ncbi:MAG: FecR domain-containing protein [Candidatus Peribacteraceae bacterium]|nr:FecR domain-containing protein [Candidatus Peribacteraceae bacterium]
MDTLGIGNHARQAAVVLLVEKGGAVQVSLDGKEFASAQNEIKLYSADRVKTAGNGHAALLFFDGTRLRLDGQTDVEVEQSDQRERDSEITVTLHEGNLWVATPETATYSGSILRQVQMGEMTLELPARTEALLSARSVSVLSAAGLGIKITLPHAVLPVIVGEGQQFALPAEFDAAGDLYQYRSPLNTVSSLSPFLESSRTLYAQVGRRSGTASSASRTEGGVLTVTHPDNHTVLRSATVTVAGEVGSAVSLLRVNGYQARIADDRTFSIEVTPPDEDSITLTVEALDSNGTVVATVLRELRRDRTPLAAPTISLPAKDGQVYRTQKTEFIVRGTAPADAAGIVVNDYRLQLFQPGDREWSYLAGTRLDNLREGENLFTVYAINDVGTKSPPVSLTIILGGEGEGVVSSAASSGAASSVPEQVSEDDLPTNDPIEPGMLKVTAPAEGTAYTTATGSLLIEGSVSATTASVWVNGYKLRLYSAGKTFWNYIADVNLGTLKKGANTYVVNARNAEGQLLDTLTYTVTYP